MPDDEWGRAAAALADKIAGRPGDLSFQQEQFCPVCGSHLKIYVGHYRRSSTKMIGVTIECSTCNQAIALDALEAV